VSVRFAIFPSSRRVYTIALVLGLGVIVLGIGCRAPDAQDRLTVDAVMTKGPVAAPVTIVEFSDYQ
jgi:protein-disulfide isomerase